MQENSPQDAWAGTLVDLLWSRAERLGDHPFVTPTDGLVDGEPLSLATLARHAERRAGGLAARGIGPGDRVAILEPDVAEFITSLFAVFRSGATAVPLAPPLYGGDHERFRRRVVGIVRSSRPVAVLCGPEMEPTLEPLPPEELQRLVPPALDGPPPSTLPAADDLAFIQYTSGSTGIPRGVALRHGTVRGHLADIVQGLQLDASDRAVSWLPLYHDMGLVGMLMSMIAADTPVWLMRPEQFLFRPARWAQAMSRVRATITTSPDFGYSLCAGKTTAAQVEGLDLSALRLALSGAEPVKVRTLDRFTARFEPAGFDRAAFLPVYGLAEATLAVTFPPLGRGPRVEHIDRRELGVNNRAVTTDPGGRPSVSVGHPFPGSELRVVASEGQLCGDREQGEIWVRGPSVAREYYGDERATRSTFFAGWLRTGDLGYRAGGELYITGRSKDVLIRAGRKFHAVDLEAAAERVPGVRQGCSAAFAVAGDRDEESIVVQVEIDGRAPQREALRRRVSRAIAVREGLRPDEVVLADPNTVPRTTSGKIRRLAARDAWLWRRDADRSSRPGE